MHARCCAAGNGVLVCTVTACISNGAMGFCSCPQMAVLEALNVDADLENFLKEHSEQRTLTCFSGKKPSICSSIC